MLPHPLRAVGSGPAFARLTIAGVIFPHGAQHALGWFGGYGFGGTLAWMTETIGIPAPFAVLAILTELVAPLALLVGWGSRLAALGVAGVMLGATATHLPNGFFMNWFGSMPAGSEGFEYHVIMIALAAVVVFEGGGAYSIDRWLAHRVATGRRRGRAAARYAAILAASLLVACADATAPGGREPVASVTMRPAAFTLTEGAITAVVATPIAGDGSPLYGRGAHWSTADAAIATVDGDGRVSGLRTGTTTISASVEGRTGRTQVTVTAIPVASVSVSPAELILHPDAAARLAAEAMNADGNPLEGRIVTWTSQDPAIARVDEAGSVTGVAPGVVTVTARSEGKEGSARVIVMAAPPGAVSRVELSATDVDLVEGSGMMLRATPVDADGRPVPGRAVTWSSSHPGIAPVRADGTVTALRAGEATITVRVDGQTASARVRIVGDHAYDLVFDALPTAGARTLQRLDLNQAVPAPVGLLPHGASASDAAISPDGTRIAFVGVVDGWPGLHVMTRDGSGLQRLTTTAADAPDASPAWSPDGRRVAFSRTSAGSGGDIWVIDADGTQPPVNLTARLGGDVEEDPAWSPAGRIAFARRAGGLYTIWTMSAEGKELRQVTMGTADLQPAWSPDGGTIVFVRLGVGSLGELWLADGAGGNERPLGMPLTGPQWDPDWSPDGRLIAFVSSHETYGGPGGAGLYTVRADGTLLVRRTVGNAEHAGPAWLRR